MTCTTNVCGTGGWSGPKPGDPDNNSILTATPAFGGIDVSWTYPSTFPYAVAHTLVYRGILSDFNAAIHLAVADGNLFFDKSAGDVPVEYFYWIQLVSVNGTYGEVIGPASAVARPTIEETIRQLTGKIDAGFLAQSLRTDIELIGLLSGNLQGEVSERIAANLAITSLVAQIQSEMDEVLGTISNEITERQEAESALVDEVNSAANAIASESLVRAAAIQSEAAQRATALLNEASARSAGLNALETKISTLEAATTGELNQLLAVIQTEQEARTTADSAQALARETLAVQMRGNYLGENPTELSTGLLYSEHQARVTAETALVNSLTALTATVNQNVAAITTEASARSTADSSITNLFNTLSTQVNDPVTGLPSTRSTLLNNYYTKSTVDSSIAAAILNLVSTTGLANALGNYPTTASLTQNYYTKAATDSAISSATSTLASTINNSLTHYTTTASLENNYYTKTETNSAISFATLNLVSTTSLNAALGAYPTTATLNNEYYTKADTNSAISTATTSLASSVNSLLAGYVPSATLTQNYYTKAATDSAISVATTALSSSVNEWLGAYTPTATLNQDFYTKASTNSAIAAATQNLVSTNALNNALTAYPTTASIDAGYYTKSETDQALAAATLNLVSTTGLAGVLAGYATNAQLVNSYYTKTETNNAISTATSTLISNADFNVELAKYTTTAALENQYYTRAQTDSVVSQAITTSQSFIGENISSAQTALQTNIDTVNGKVTNIGALYTAKVSINGLIGGFGVYNNGTEVEAGFDVDRFWVGRTSSNKTKPFIIENDEVFIDNAVIHNLTADKIDTRGLSIRDANGNVILSAGSALDFSNVGGSTKPANNATVGAPNGTYVGSILAENVESEAGAQIKANNALNSVASGANLCPNADFSNGLTGWTVIRNNFSAVLAIQGAGPDWAVNNGVGDGATTASIHQGNGTTTDYFEVISDPIPVEAGKRYCVSAYTGAHRCIADVFVYWYTSTNVYISDSGSNADYNDAAFSGGAQLSNYKRHQQFGVAPANASNARISLRKFGTKAGNSDSWVFIARVQLEQVGALATSAGPWSAPGASNALQAVLNSKLDEASSEILNIDTSSAVRMAGVRIGNLVWDASGNRTSGTGIALTPAGLLGHNGSHVTFAVNATTGDATFAGALSAATGTFAGSLSAATGSFSGSLTASAVNAVNTINVAGNAITVPSSAFTYATKLANSGNTWTTVQSVTVTTSGERVFIASSGTVIIGELGGGNGLDFGTFRLMRGSDFLMGSDIPSMSFSEQPSAGTHTYSLQIASAVFGTNTYDPPGLSNRSLFVIETKR